MKRKISNTGDTIFNHNFFNIRVVVYRAWIVITIVIFHRPFTADGQRAVGGECPGQVVFYPYLRFSRRFCTRFICTC